MCLAGASMKLLVKRGENRTNRSVIKHLVMLEGQEPQKFDNLRINTNKKTYFQMQNLCVLKLKPYTDTRFNTCRVPGSTDPNIDVINVPKF